MKKILVTGANGHLGYNLTRLLAQKGYPVRVTVRSLSDSAKAAHLKPLGVEMVEADIMKPETLNAAMQGIEGVFQVAAVYSTVARDPQKEIIDPSIIGGINVLEAAKSAGVQKVVFTSSVAAVGTVAPGGKPRTEADWNERALDPYTKAKTEAEKRAWAFAKANDLNLVTILPSAIIGPGFYRHTPSTLMFEMLLRGKLPFVLPMSLGLVDVRDAAIAHLMAYENPQAIGRYIATAYFSSIEAIFKRIGEIDPKITIPRFKFPASLLGILPALDWMSHQLMGAPRFATRKFIAEYGGRDLHCSSDRIRQELGWTPIALQQSLSDTLQWIRKTFLKQALDCKDDFL